jgi:predicted AAA+ superfamily ATPase
MDLTKVWELDRLARRDAGYFVKKRHLFSVLMAEQGRHFTGIVGPRGVGKTVVLKQLAAENADSLYLSLDTWEEGDVFEAVRVLTERQRLKILLLDEVHFLPNFQQTLKKIFDFLPVKLIFSSSVALALTDSAYDLSRRVKLLPLMPFTLGEYIFFREGAELPCLTLSMIVQQEYPAECLKHLVRFEEYLQGSLYPFALEEPDALPFLRNMLDKIIERDIPSVARLTVDDLGNLRKMLAFIGKSPVDGINYSSISRNIGVTKYKAEIYIHLLKQAFVLNPVFPSGTNVLREPKVLMHLPFRLLYLPYAQALGALREDFFGEMLGIAGLTFHYLKSRRGAKTPDFLVREGTEDFVFEIGGQSKGYTQFKGVTAERKIVLAHAALPTRKNAHPLALIGFLPPQRG